MRALHLLAAVAGLALLCGLGAGRAQPLEGEARCLVLGPLVVSSYVAFLDKVAAKERTAAAARAENTADLIDLYDRLGCAMAPLMQTVECLSAALIDAKTREPVAEIAETCMREAGMPVR